MRKRPLLFIIALFAGLIGAPAPSALAAERNPVLFVHGISSGPAIWNDMVRDFVAAGYSRDQLRSFQYNYLQPNATTAVGIRSQVDDLLARTHAHKVDIVAHSMGGLSTRYYMNKLGGLAKVDDFVSIASPHHGTSLAAPCKWLKWVPFTKSCVETARFGPFVNALNAGDETPGAVSYTTVISTCDEVVFPHNTSELKGANNVYVGCLEHAFMPTFQRVRTVTRQAVR